MVEEAWQQLQASGGSEAVTVRHTMICAHHDSPQHLSNVNGYIYQTTNIYVFPGGPVVQRLYRVQHLYGTPSSMLHAMHTSLAMMS